MDDKVRYIKPQVRALKPYTLKQYTHQIKLNQNENPFGFPDELKHEVWRRLHSRDWARYPDFYLRDITEGLAEYAGVSPDWVLVGNGSNELLQMILLATVTPGDRVIVPVPTFTLYHLQGIVMGATVLEPPLSEPHFSLPTDKIVELIQTDTPKVVVLCSPNNPTGNTHPIERIRPIIEAATTSLVLLDEAYVEFSAQNLRSLLDEYENVALLRTFSKAWALAGARVGYLIAPPQLIQEINKIKLPYGLNILSETAALVALEHKARLHQQVTEIIRQRQQLFEALQALPGVHPYPSQANFILCRFDRSTKEVFEACLEAGILIRDVSYYPGLEGHLRISVGTETENAALMEALASFLI